MAGCLPSAASVVPFKSFTEVMLYNKLNCKGCTLLECPNIKKLSASGGGEDSPLAHRLGARPRTPPSPKFKTLVPSMVCPFKFPYVPLHIFAFSTSVAESKKVLVNENLTPFCWLRDHLHIQTKSS